MKLTKQQLLDQINVYPDKYDGEEILSYLALQYASINPSFAIELMKNASGIAAAHMEEMVQVLNYTDEMAMYAIDVLNDKYMMPDKPEECRKIQAENLTSVRNHVKKTLRSSRRLNK